MSDAKQRLRASIQKRRREVASEQARAAGQAVAAIVTQTRECDAAQRVALYAALPDELPTRAVFEALAEAGRACLFPRVAGDRLEFARVKKWEDLVPGRYGVLEPPRESQDPALGRSDLVLVPGVAFDRRGNRLGRGGGYYDRAFAVVKEEGPVLFGIAYSFQLLDEIPCDEHDRAMDAVISELGIQRFEREQ